MADPRLYSHVPQYGEQVPSLTQAMASVQLQSPLVMRAPTEPKYFTDASAPISALSRSNSIRSDASDMQPPPASYFVSHGSISHSSISHGSKPHTLPRSSSMRSDHSSSSVVIVAAAADRPPSRSSSFRSTGSNRQIRTSFRGQTVDALPTLLQAPRLPAWRYPIYPLYSAADLDANALSAPSANNEEASLELAGSLGDAYHAVLTEHHGVHRSDRLAKITAAFTSQAQKTVATIVAELPLAFAEKSIPPLADGDATYEKDNIIYRMCAAEGVAPASDSIAMKGASLELKSATALLSTRVTGLHVPLCGVFTHFGYRFFVTADPSFRENDDSSLIYGSLDGGCTVKNTDPVFDHLIRRASSLLNVKEHPVGASQVYFSLSGDSQGHLGGDGRYYVVNTSRLYPPFPPEQQGSTSRFHKRMRPEFVLLSKVPLSSDSFSAWAVGPNRDVDNETTAAFASQLHEDLIPRIAKALDGYSSQRKDMDITTLLHRNGINMRYLALFLPHLTVQDSRVSICAEMIARWFRQWMFEKLRKCRGDEMSVRIIASQCFNDILVREPHSPEFYMRVVRPGLLEKYGLETTYSLELDQEFLFKRMQAVTGFKFSQRSVAGARFKPGDIVEINPLVKTIRIRPLLVAHDLIDDGRLEEAEILLKKELERREQQPEENQYTIINLCRNLALLSMQQERYKEAEDYFSKMLVVIKSFLGEQSHDFQEAMELLARLYDITQPAKGLELHNKVVDVLKARLGSHPRLVGLMIALAEHFLLNKRPEVVLRICSDAYAMHTKGKSRLQYRFTSAIQNLVAQAQRDLGDWQKARSVAEPCLQEVTQRYGKFSFEALPLLETINSIYKHLNLVPQWTESLQRSIRIMQSRYGDLHPSTAAATEDLVKLFQQTNNSEGAERLMVHMLSIRETKYGPSSIEVAPYLNNLAIYYAESNKDPEKALNLFSRVLNIRLQSLGQMNALVASVMFNIANVLYSLGRLPESLQYSESALRIQEVVLGPTHPDVAITLRSMASIYHDENRLTAAENLLHRALSIALSALGPDHPDTADIYHSLALLCSDMKKTSEALSYAQNAYRTMSKEYGPTHAETKELLALVQKLQS
eukprot:TRINITY_DN5237_c0_g1_i1.p1 TRINITY_DN5237_c0_g1~~TRINITY_DN5237_c0_g1_i1.p1  ORF type:complete len:1101 (-),score=225.70 TRINITY_DN5237_c0_g1_i1:443-3745(-)